ncbi:transcriptional regulator Spx [Lacticaseibacillus jixiensis]|uniref:transcriptional regulator Spx n=1 Tax=Lacticaseibacillus jixiensis TaxID=3231926 RepID=UPI0036F387C0
MPEHKNGAHTLYFFWARNCTSSRKAEEWLKEAHIAYQPVELVPGSLTATMVKEMLRLSEKGTDEILSTRSKYYPELQGRMDGMTTEELVDLIVERPDLLRHPIMIDGLRMQVGFHEDQIRRFLPREVRAIALQQAQLLAGF